MLVILLCELPRPGFGYWLNGRAGAELTSQLQHKKHRRRNRSPTGIVCSWLGPKLSGKRYLEACQIVSRHAAGTVPRSHMQGRRLIALPLLATMRYLTVGEQADILRTNLQFVATYTLKPVPSSQSTYPRSAPQCLLLDRCQFYRRWESTRTSSTLGYRKDWIYSFGRQAGLTQRARSLIDSPPCVFPLCKASSLRDRTSSWTATIECRYLRGIRDAQTGILNRLSIFSRSFNEFNPSGKPMFGIWFSFPDPRLGTLTIVQPSPLNLIHCEGFCMDG